MLALVSAAKTLDFDSSTPTPHASQPEFWLQAEDLLVVLRPLTLHDISKLMVIRDKLGVLYYVRFAFWQSTFRLDKGMLALFAVKGDRYVGLTSKTIQKWDWK